MSDVQQEMLHELKQLNQKVETAFNPPPRKKVRESQRDPSIHRLQEGT